MQDQVPRWARIGLAGAVSIYLGLGFLWVLAVSPFGPADERLHVDYAYEVAHGHIPVAGSRYVAEFPTIGQRSGTNYVTYHPPAYYALVGPLVRLGADSSHPRLAIHAVRSVGVLLTAVSVALVFMLARRVFAHWEPARRTQIAILAAAFAGTVPSLIGATASVQNDPLVILFVMIACVLVAHLVRGGPTWKRLVILGVVSGLGMLSRVSFVQVLVMACLTTVFLFLFPGRPSDQPDLPRPAERDPWWPRIKQATLRVLPVGLLPIAISGWFFGLNYHRYGSFDAQNIAPYIVAHRALDPRNRTMLGYMFHPYSWWIQLQQLGGASAGTLRDPGWAPRVIAAVLIATLAVGLAMVVLRRSEYRLDRNGTILLVGLLVVLLISYVEIASHVIHKGAESNRYLIDALPFWGILLALAVLALGPRRIPWAVPPILAMQIFATANFTLTIIRRQRSLDGDSTLSAIANSMAKSGVSHARIVLGVLIAVMALGFLAVCASVVALGRRPSPVGDGRAVA